MRISSASVVVLVPSERVFAFIRDQAKLKCWQPEVIDSHLLSGDGSAAGSRWRVTLKDPARGRFELETWIVGLRENEQVVYAWQEATSSRSRDAGSHGNGGQGCPERYRFQDRGHRPCQHSGYGPAAFRRLLSKNVRLLRRQRGQAARNRSSRYEPDSGLFEPSKPGQTCRSLRDWRTPFHQGSRHTLFDPARGPYR